MGRNLVGGSAVASPSSGSSSSSSSSSSDDPRKEGLPCIATWSMQDDNARRFDCVVYDSTGSRMGSPWGSGLYSSPSDYYGGVMADKYWGINGDNGNYWRTNGTLASNNTSYVIKATCYNGFYPQHAMMNIAPTGGFSSNRMASSDNLVRAFQHHVTQVLPEGIRPRCSLTRESTYLFRSLALNISNNRGAPGGDRMNLWDDSELVTKFGQDNISPKNNNNNLYQGVGACGYNEKNKTFIIVWNQNSTRTIAFTKWKFTQNLNDVNVSLRDIFLTASSVETTPHNTMNLGWSGTQEAHRFLVTVGDNDYIRMSQFRESNHFRTYLITPDLTIDPGTHDSNGEYSHSITTSYGMEQGWRHIGSNYNSTWDNKWHIHYSHYYYYGCGIAAFVTSTEDPRLVYKFNYSGTSDGNSPFPWGKRGFIMNRSTNSDSQDLSYFNLDLKDMKTTKEAFDAEAGRYYSYGEYVQPSIGSTLNINDYSYWMPSHGWSSTNYPCFLTVNWWPTHDGRNYYSGQEGSI